MKLSSAKLSAGALVVMAALAAAGVPDADADPLPFGPDTCLQGFVWREARVGDVVCVTPGVRARTAQENANPLANRQPGGGASGPDTCLQGFVWRDAFAGDHVCVTPAIRSEAAADNAAAASRKQANAPKPVPPPAPKQGPAVNWSPRIGGLTAHVTDRSGVAAQCEYRSDWYTRSFFLPANSSFDLVIVPAIPKFQNWNVEISCDNGTSTQTSTFF
ncbi:hypothetical protein BH10ACT9_BH10ACT9_33200 [soil metagenome]